MESIRIREPGRRRVHLLHGNIPIDDTLIRLSIRGSRALQQPTTTSLNAGVHPSAFDFDSP